MTQRRQDDNKNKMCDFEGGAVFLGKRYDNNILKVQLLFRQEKGTQT